MTAEHTRRLVHPTLVRVALAVAALIAVTDGGRGPNVTLVAAGSACGPTINPIACENQQPGNPASEWDIVGAGEASIQGFATNISVNRGGTVSFKIKGELNRHTVNVTPA